MSVQQEHILKENHIACDLHFSVHKRFVGKRL